MEKLVIALVGPQLAGKGKFVEAIKGWCQEGCVSHLCTGDILRSILGTLGRPQDRPNCDKLVSTLVAGYGEGFLAQAMEARILRDPKPVIIFDCMRLLTDELMVLGLPVKTLRVHVTAPVEVRYQRCQERRRSDEHKLTLEEFCQIDELPMEKLIHEIGTRTGVIQMETCQDYGMNDAKRLAFCDEHLAEYAAPAKEAIMFP